MKKKILLSFLCLMACLHVSAQDFTVGDIKYKVQSAEDKTCEIIGNIGVYGNVSLPVNVEYDASTYTVTSIAEEAFENCSSLTAITIPEGVTTISDNVFRYCSSLSSITIPTSVTSIGGGAFYGCSKLTSITIPSNVTSIGNRAFSGCSSLTAITIPESVTTIGNGVFSGCSSLTAIIIPTSVTSIGPWSFSGCSELASITIPSSVTSISDNAFRDCSSLSSITIPEGVTSISAGVFYGCTSLTSISLPKNAASIGDEAFKDCKNLVSISLPEKIEVIGRNTFMGCDKLASITIPEGAISIGNDAFKDCSNLASVTIPNTVKSIGEGAFWACRKLESIVIPNGVTSIQPSIFGYCEKLASVTIPNSVTSIGEQAFWACGLQNPFIIPNSVESIGAHAFQECKGLTSITIPSSVNSIAAEIFLYCDNLSSVVFESRAPYTYVNLSAPNACKLIVPNGTRAAYLEENWDECFRGGIVDLFDETSTVSPVDDVEGEGVGVFVRRTIKADEWSTLVLPFDITEEQVKAAFGEDVLLADFTGCIAEEDGSEVSIQVNFQSTKAITANQPCLIKVSKDMTDFTLDDIDITPNETPVKTIKGDDEKQSSFIGTYVAQTDVPENCYFISGNKFYRSIGTTKTKAFRAYFDFSDVLAEFGSAQANIRFMVDAEATEIGSIAAENVNNSGVYTLQGAALGNVKDVKSLPKGIYIVNGKKVIVK